MRLCHGALRDCLHLLTAQWLLGREARALCPSGQLFSLCGDKGGLQVTILTRPVGQGPSLLHLGTGDLGHPHQQASRGFYGTAWVGPGWYRQVRW